MAVKPAGEHLHQIHLSEIVVPEVFREYRKELFDPDGSPRFDNSLFPLAESIEKNGLLQPILVRSKGKDQYELIFGLQRLRAHEYLYSQGKKNFSVITTRLVKMDDPHALAAMFVENERRKNPTFASLCATATQLAEGGMDSNKIAESLGEPSSTVRHALTLWKRAADELKDALAEGKVSRIEATEIAKRPKAEQLAALEKLLESEDRAGDENRAQRAVRRRKAADILPPSVDEGSTLAETPSKMKSKDFVSAAQYILQAKQTPAAKPVSDAFLVAANKMSLRDFLTEHFSQEEDVLVSFGVRKKRGRPRKEASAGTAEPRRSLFKRATA